MEQRVLVVAITGILMYPPETAIAEKFEAIVRFGEVNGRIKDFYDIWITTRTLPFDLPILVEAISGTTRRRETAFPTEMPVGLTEAFAAVTQKRGLWTGFLRRTQPSLKPPPFPQLQQDLRLFFGPIVDSLGRPEGAKGRCDQDVGAWH
ncbi:nucleotidyl transferase AbiEii/AbiGii toxin family protein [Bradyrhizobium sp. STM 3561]|uniref:nucleotidyl transferase AbiEii/AbiGii toxin family protein n=1 Tax=unclassified Bradyrhizobium TaxID=2631580 RepID=UPI00389075BC